MSVTLYCCFDILACLSLSESHRGDMLIDYPFSQQHVAHIVVSKRVLRLANNHSIDLDLTAFGACRKHHALAYHRAESIDWSTPAGLIFRP